MHISIIKADITVLDVDIIVNAANRALLGGGGVDGAIHEVAGHELLDECLKIRKEKYINGLPTGYAVITKAYNLPCKYVIHTVGPIYGKDNINLLKDCYLNSLKIAEEHKCKTIAFPSISTGSYNVPIEKAVLLVKEVLDKFKPSSIQEIILVLYSEKDCDIYKKVFYE